MTNRVVWGLVVKRAEAKAASATSVIEATPFETSVGSILYADNRIKELEARVRQLEALAEFNALTIK